MACGRHRACRARCRARMYRCWATCAAAPSSGMSLESISGGANSGVPLRQMPVDMVNEGSERLMLELPRSTRQRSKLQCAICWARGRRVVRIMMLRKEISRCTKGASSFWVLRRISPRRFPIAATVFAGMRPPSAGSVSSAAASRRGRPSIHSIRMTGVLPA